MQDVGFTDRGNMALILVKEFYATFQNCGSNETGHRHLVAFLTVMLSPVM